VRRVADERRLVAGNGGRPSALIHERARRRFASFAAGVAAWDAGGLRRLNAQSHWLLHRHPPLRCARASLTTSVRLPGRVVRRRRSGLERRRRSGCAPHRRPRPSHKEGSSLETAIEQEFSWEALERDGQAAGRLARPLHGSPLQDFRAQFPQFRQYTPKFLETFQFEAIPAQQPLLKALEVLRQMNREERTRVLSDAPRSFVRPIWAPFVFTGGGIDRCYYELCALSELSWGLQAGDIWIPGSRRYRKFGFRCEK